MPSNPATFLLFECRVYVTVSAPKTPEAALAASVHELLLLLVYFDPGLLLFCEES
jgi:hypothetical protein